jgi:hypothetical protein
MSGLRARRALAAARTESSAGTVAVGSPIEADTVRVPVRRRRVVVERVLEAFLEPSLVPVTRLRVLLARLDPPVVATVIPPPPMRGVYPPGMAW